MLTDIAKCCVHSLGDGGTEHPAYKKEYVYKIFCMALRLRLKHNSILILQMIEFPRNSIKNANKNRPFPGSNKVQFSASVFEDHRLERTNFTDVHDSRLNQWERARFSAFLKTQRQ